LVEPEPQRVILVPQRPRDDLLRLAASQGAGVLWPDDSGNFEL
jgi:hypothetical protein